MKCFLGLFIHETQIAMYSTCKHATYTCLYIPCWMTVSPAMWVTGNMASNMSLKEKKTERGEEEGRGEEGGRTQLLPTYLCYYAALLSHTDKHASLSSGKTIIKNKEQCCQWQHSCTYDNSPNNPPQFCSPPDSKTSIQCVFLTMPSLLIDCYCRCLDWMQVWNINQIKISQHHKASTTFSVSLY